MPHAPPQVCKITDYLKEVTTSHHFRLLFPGTRLLDCSSRFGKSGVKFLLRKKRNKINVTKKPMGNHRAFEGAIKIGQV